MSGIKPEYCMSKNNFCQENFPEDEWWCKRGIKCNKKSSGITIEDAKEIASIFLEYYANQIDDE